MRKKYHEWELGRGRGQKRAFEHLLLIIREGAPHKQAKAIFPDGSCRSFQITALLARNKNTRIIPDTPHLPSIQHSALLLQGDPVKARPIFREN